MSSTRRKLFAPTPMASTANGTHDAANDDAVLAAAMAADESRRSYSLRRRAPVASTSTSTSAGAVNGSAAQQKRSLRTAAATKRARSVTPSDASDSAADSDFSDANSGDVSSDGGDSDVFTASTSPKSKTKTKSAVSTPAKRTRKTAKAEDGAEQATPPKRRTKPKSASSSPAKKPAASPFDVSPRKPSVKPIKLNLEPHEAHPAPEHWETVYALLAHQRTKIVAPVDTMGCEENGREDRRADKDQPREVESPEEAGKRERLATLVSLMLSSQTKDPVTAEAVYNLQRTLPNGLCLQSLLEADDETISSCIAKVGFWRRKTGYLKSAARILASDFNGDVPRTPDELCSLPGVGPKMAFLALSSMGIQLGIGVDTHVHRLTNRLGWHKTQTPEQTRLNLQSWLPHELHGKINRLLVGFGQVICVPVGPRCDLCAVGNKGLCPSYRDVDAKAALKRVKVELLDSADEGVTVEQNWVKVKKDKDAQPKVKVEVEIDGPDGTASMDIADLTKPIKVERQDISVKEEQIDAAIVEKVLEW